MIPVSLLHFLIFNANLILALAAWKFIATRNPDSRFAQAIGFLFF